MIIDEEEESYIITRAILIALVMKPVFPPDKYTIIAFKLLARMLEIGAKDYSQDKLTQELQFLMRDS